METSLSYASFKKGRGKDINNYWLISIISAPYHTHGLSLLKATNSWSVNIDNGFINGVICIDLKTAFNTIHPKILPRNLASYEVDHKALK